MVTILGTVTYQWRRDIPSLDWRLWLLKTVSGGLILVIASHLHYAGIGGKPVTEEDPKVRALAEHLTKIKAKFYGAYWCPHCEEQKEMFGASAHRLPYIECSPQGSRSPQAAICRAAGIKTYPTWIIDAQRHEGVLSLNQLANISGFKGDF
ncbi:MAG: hypothetical protein HY694_03025 [Deltaproteobacteria bacterium]|nr:hypothetical protein [Deltaproteobacteria bacterium]